MKVYKIQNILVPVDLSETSLNALQSATALAKKHNAGLYLLFIEESVKNLFGPEFEGGESLKANIDVLTSLAGAIKHAHNISPTVVEKEGCVLEAILKTSHEFQCDLIVIGSHGASGFRDDYIGSNAYNVIKYATCPVLTIPPARKFTSFRKVLFPIRPVSGALFPYHIATEFLSSKCMVDVVGLSYLNIEKETTVLDKIVDEIRPDVEDDKVNIKTFWGKGISVANDILQFAQQNNSDLILLTTILDAIPKPNFIGPHTQKVINGSKVPLLSIKSSRVFSTGFEVSRSLF